MHMADALISPAVGATMWTAAAGLIAHSSKRSKMKPMSARCRLWVYSGLLFSPPR
jgi:hypothetical protein